MLKYFISKKKKFFWQLLKIIKEINKKIFEIKKKIMTNNTENILI